MQEFSGRCNVILLSVCVITLANLAAAMTASIMGIEKYKEFSLIVSFVCFGISVLTITVGLLALRMSRKAMEREFKTPYRDRRAYYDNMFIVFRTGRVSDKMFYPAYNYN